MKSLGGRCILSRFVPTGGTSVGFTSEETEHTLWSSSSGGGLFGRSVTRKSYGALLNWETSSPRRIGFVAAPWSIQVVQFPISPFERRPNGKCA